MNTVCMCTNFCQKGDGDSEIALVVEDEDMIETTMDGKPYMATRFAATLRRKLYRGTYSALAFADVMLNCYPEHLGLMPPQLCTGPHEEVTSFMRPAPVQNNDETQEDEDRLVADPLADETVDLWNRTAKNNRDIFTEVFRPVPTNLVRDWDAYSVC